MRHDEDEEHPHRLLEDDQDRDVTSVVPQNGIYRVAYVFLLFFFLVVVSVLVLSFRTLFEVDALIRKLT